MQFFVRLPPPPHSGRDEGEIMLLVVQRPEIGRTVRLLSRGYREVAEPVFHGYWKTRDARTIQRLRAEAAEAARDRRQRGPRVYPQPHPPTNTERA